MDRRTFLHKSLTLGAGALFAGSSILRGGYRQSSDSLTILYTNDTHARLDPFPDNATQIAGL